MRTHPSISGRKYRKSVYNAVFIHNKSLNVVSAAATGAYALWAIKYGPSNMGKYYSCCSTGNTIGAYTRYIIRENCSYLHIIL